MFRRILIIPTVAIFISSYAYPADLDHSISGDEVEDVLSNSSTPESSPYIINGKTPSSLENSKSNNEGEDFMFSQVPEVTGKNDPKQKFEDVGYTLPGTFEKNENYIELDKNQMAKEFRNVSSGGINLSFIKNGYTYQSRNDVINRTVGTGYKSIKGGSLFVRNDSYFYRTTFVNTYWALGAGLGYNSGKGIFVTGERSETTFNLWEIPIDLGLGLEIPISSWFKLAATGGPSVMGLMQSRSDFERGEKGKRKTQYSYGQFANLQMKINLTGFSGESAYDLFASSEITNLFMNLEARYQSYRNFQDDIKISGTSFGIGFTFEYL